VTHAAVVLTAAEVAALVGGVVEGDGAVRLVGVAGLEEAGPEHLSFLANRRYARLAAETRAGAVLVGPTDRAAGRTVIRCPDPYLAFARALERFHPAGRPAPGIHPLAVVEGDAAGATVGAFAYVGADAVVGAGSVLMPGAYVGAGARVGRECRLMPGSCVMDGCVVGDRTWLNPGAVVGAEGFGFVPTGAGLVKIPQTGRAVVGDDVELGANSCVDRAAMGDTTVGSGTKIDNLVQVGHAAEIGPNCTMVAYSGVAGSTRVGAGTVLAARATVLGHLEIGAGTQVGAMSMVTADTEPGERRSGIPAIPHARWLRLATSLPDLPELLARVRALEAEVARLKAGS
jgi:UDP-3-O-[3-hydroxymyristoyl] glucosamine N-acyltransferase